SDSAHGCRVPRTSTNRYARLGALVGDGGLAEVRGRGLWAGAELAPRIGLGRPISEELARRGILVKETHETTLRFAPPIVITRDEIDHAVDTLAAVLSER
ncbi:aminotransferase class III-fold pyridoxal phosphate-dependent enzyme, partial [Nakamurella sp. GG22]